jgi:DNA (cytosine-5)-methyltransferase 1
MTGAVLNHLDLFAGIGGFSLGFERTGRIRTVALCEIDEYPRRVLAKHWPDVPIYPDVCTLTGEQLRADGFERIDVISGGFPCQDISLAGEGLGLYGDRSGLWREFARLIREIRPRFVVVENVAALLFRGLGDVLGDLASLGYDAEWHCLTAQAVGFPHIRDRVFITAYDSANRRQGDSARTFSEFSRIPWGENERMASDFFKRPDLHGPRLCAPNNGVSVRLAGIGNAVVPQLAEIIGRAILVAIDEGKFK